ncbi:hypothetical protein Tco_1049979 [Tanacetum coccineum]
MPSPSCAKLNLNTPVSNPFDVLNTVKEDANDHNPKVSEPIDSGSSKVDDVKVQEDDILWKRFQRSKKVSSQKDDTDEESEVEEYPPYDTTGISSTGGGFSLEDELTFLCLRMVPEEEDKVESLMDQKIHVFAARQVDNKRRMENNSRDEHVQQPPYKRQNVARAYTAGPGEKKEYAGTLPLTTATCYECGEQGHYKSNFSKLKNQNHGNQTGNDEAWGRVYALVGGEVDQDPNNIADNADA